MFASSLLRYQGTPAILYDQTESNAQKITFFSSRAQSLKMLGSARSNVELFWVDPSLNIVPGMIVRNQRDQYYLVVKEETDNPPLQMLESLVALNVLAFTTVLSGQRISAVPGAPRDAFGDPAPGALQVTPLSLRVIIDLNTSLFEESPAGLLPSGTLTVCCAPGADVQMTDEYTWKGIRWRVQQVNPEFAAGQQYGIQVLLKQTKTQGVNLT